MKKRNLLGLLSIAGLAVFGLSSCGNNNSPSTPSSDTPSSDTPSSDTPSSDTPSSDTPSETKMTREQFLNKIDELATANAAARAAMTTYKASMSTTVNGNKLPESHTGEFTITNGKITVLDKEITILTTKASFEADYLDGVTSYENEVYGLLSGNYQFNITMTKNDGNQYMFIGSLTPQGTLNAGRYYRVGSDGKKTTIWWLAPSAA